MEINIEYKNGYEWLLKTVGKVQKYVNPSLKVDGVLMTLVDARTTFASEVPEMIRQMYPRLRIYSNQIPINDSSKASFMLSDGSYSCKHSAAPFDSQAYFMEQSSHIPVSAVVEKERLSKRFVHLLHKVFESVK